ncbi:hypothetical protein CEUSTIGMA_g3249.t1 [Chlamydomonas eustigma]|uniref:Uncharacterized protein n=1 Tax=Chlamydomonas eustigma TaxID=1157962 RepID=A0A250WYE4_9CHLO|nr:hypothetical protein CEUSTIGMA_g3249.t1 [Chlamydomonas eustigma]|eukprot:GAX75806.1 hypothetical protein CEUSTIGMA_g3249.t1 [Chlamydomonas eustigma]
MAATTGTVAIQEWKGGEIVFAGGTDWAQEEAARDKLYPNLHEPHRLKSLAGIKIAFISGGTSAVHCLAGDVDGRLYTWGRNEGQLGMGNIKKSSVKGFEDLQLSPVKCIVSEAIAVAAGADFTVWIAGGKALAAGNPQYGQLGDGSDHAYNSKDSSICIIYDPQPTPKSVKGTLAEKTVTRIACGQNHSIAVDNEGAAYTWGSGSYGRLGHRVQQDELLPRKVEEFKGRISVPADAVIAAGGNASFCTVNFPGQIYSWGKLKASGDSQMYPQNFMDLSGWNVRSFACGPAHYVVAADSSAITWGQATNGELGYGVNGKKSSANAAKCNALEGFRVHQVAAGVGYSMFLVGSDEKGLEKLPVFESTAPETAAAGASSAEAAEAEAAGGSSKGGKRKAVASEAKAPASKSKKAAK